MGAAPSGRPGCPDSAFWTASIASVRIVSTQSSSTDFRTMLNQCLSCRLFDPAPESYYAGSGGLGFRFQCEAGKLQEPCRNLGLGSRSGLPDLRELNAAVETWSESGTIRTSPRKPLEWQAEDLAEDDAGAHLEWLETDGLGGFACGSAAGAGTQEYHGWYSPPLPASA